MLVHGAADVLLQLVLAWQPAVGLWLPVGGVSVLQRLVVVAVAVLGHVAAGVMVVVPVQPRVAATVVAWALVLEFVVFVRTWDWLLFFWTGVGAVD